MRHDSVLARILDHFADRRPAAPSGADFSRRLPSELRAAHFTADFDVVWSTGAAPLSPSEEARVFHDLTATARHATEVHSVLHADEAETAVNLALGGHAGPVATVRATLQPEPEGVELAREHETFERRTVLAAAERLEEMNRLLHLRDHVLADPALARLWWLDGNRDRLVQLVEMNGVFEEVITILTTGSRNAIDFSSLVTDFLSGLTPDDHAVLVSQLGHVFSSYEREDLALRLRTPNGDRAHPTIA